jgi:hypothetical protein
MVVVIVAQQHERDRGEILEPETGCPHPPGTDATAGPRVAREHRIGEEREPVALDQKRRMADERDRDLTRHRLGWSLHGHANLSRPGRSLGPKQGPQLRDRLAIRPARVEEARTVEMVGHRGGHPRSSESFRGAEIASVLSAAQPNRLARRIERSERSPASDTLFSHPRWP